MIVTCVSQRDLGDVDWQCSTVPPECVVPNVSGIGSNTLGLGYSYYKGDR